MAVGDSGKQEDVGLEGLHHNRVITALQDKNSLPLMACSTA